MQRFADRLRFLFGTNKGLLLVVFAMTALTVAIWGTLSGPLAELGVKDVTVKLLGMELNPLEREGRMVILYHSIAMAATAALVYLITGFFPMKKTQRTYINAVVTVGYLSTLIFGLVFAYFGQNWALHGVYLFGLSLMALTGLMLTVVLWPWSKDYREASGRINMERTALWVVVVCFIISALYGAVPGSFYGNGFHTFLAEDTIRLPIKTSLQLAVIGHLHIMVALVGAGVLICVSRWTKFRESGSKLYTWAMPLAILGALILSAGVWIIVIKQDLAHLIIYAGSAMLLPSGLIILIYTWMKIVCDRKAELGIKKIGFGRGVIALLRSPFWFATTWMMLFMNFVVTFIGLFMAATLDEWRHYPLLMERITLSGHWHILSTIIAIMMMFIYANRIGLKGKIAHWFVWPVLIGSNVAFAAMAIYSMKHLFIEEAVWQPLIDTLMILADIGLVLVLINLAALMIWRLVDLFKADGRWRKELDEASSMSEEVTPL